MDQQSQRRALYLEELKVRWKKAALETCSPCPTITAPGAPTNVLVTDGLQEGEVIVTFTPPISDGGSPITEYEVVASVAPPGVNSPTISSYPLKSVLIEDIRLTSNDKPLTLAENTNEPVSDFVLSSNIIAKGSNSPITVKGLIPGILYFFWVIAKNIFGFSPPPASSNTTGFTPKVFVCAAGAASSSPSVAVNTAMTSITHTTTTATGIGSATGLPAGVTAAWASNTITISGTPTATGTFNYTIPLNGTGCSGVNATGTITVTAPAPAFTCGTSTITDVDGNTYNTVSIGTQCWMSENLRVTKYRGVGTPLIPLDASGGAVGTTGGETWSGLSTGARTVYAHDNNNLTTYGYLYNWFAVNDARGLCPSGWHVPTDDEWTTLTDYLGGTAVAGGKMKSTSSLWNAPNTGADNSSGFSALPGGYRRHTGPFQVISLNAYFWSATPVSGNARNRNMANGGISVGSGNGNKALGASVRCLRD